MSNLTNETFLTASIDQYLLSLASSACQTQRQISRMRVQGEFGQPSTIYQLPRLDFELNLLFQTTENAAGGNNLPTLRAYPAGAYGLNADSTIKGTFIAASAEETGPDIRVTLNKTSPTSLDVEIKAVSDLSVPLEGVNVDFDLDREMSRKLNEADSDYNFSPETAFLHSFVSTDETGYAKNTLNISPDETSDYLAVAIHAGGTRKLVVYKA